MDHPKEIKRLDRADHGRSAGERGASTAGDVETSDDDYDLVYSDRVTFVEV